jgi:hypothetical protein
MRLSILVYAVLASLVFSATFPDEYDDDLFAFSDDVSIRIGKFIRRGVDSPEALAAILGDHQVAWADIRRHFHAIQHANLIQSMRYLLPRIQFESDEGSYTISASLTAALDGHHLEMLDLLLEQEGVDPIRRLEYLQQRGYFYNFWMRRSMNTDAPFQWTVDELAGLITRHPQLARLLKPQAWGACRDAQRLLLMLDFLPHLRTAREEFAQDPECGMDFVKGQIFSNAHLSDEEMRLVLERLLQLNDGRWNDPEMKEVVIADFRNAHPNHVLSLQYLQDALGSTDIKEPGME